VSKQAEKSRRKLQRQEEERRRDRRMRLIFWGTGALFILIVALAIIFQPKEKGVEVDYASLPRLGGENAAVKIVEFGDFKCPSCKYFTEQIEPLLEKDYVEPGKAAFYFANFSIISGSKPAALGAQAAFRQGDELFWDYYRAVYKHQGDERTDWATPDGLIDILKQENVALDYDRLKKDIEEATYENEVDDQYNLAKKAGLTGTPSLLINGKRYDGGLDYNSIKQAIDDALEAAE